MLLKLILLLTVVPLLELFLLVHMTPLWGGIGVTVLVVVATGVIGAALARHEGLRVLRAVQQRMAQGELPTDDLLDGMMILVAGALLVTPGLLTDAAGFFLLVPVSRAIVRGLLKAWIGKKIKAGQMQFHTDAGFGPISQEPPPGFPPLEDDEDLP